MRSRGKRSKRFRIGTALAPLFFLPQKKIPPSVRALMLPMSWGIWCCTSGLNSEELEDPKTLKLIEAEANRFASAFLMPRKSFPNEVYTSRLDAFVELKRRWKVAIQAMVYRCKDLGIFDEFQITNLYKQISFRKWRTREPLDNQIPLEVPQLLKRAAEAVIAAGKRTGDEMADEIRVAPAIVATLCGLSRDIFVREAPVEFVPTLR